MSTAPLYRALADDTRRKIIVLLLSHNYCVSELARHLKISESAVSQHLKILKEADLLAGEKRGHYMHYDIDRTRLHTLANDIEQMAKLERTPCTHDGHGKNGCGCHHTGASCSDELKIFCHGTANMNEKEQLPLAPAQKNRE